MSDLDKMAQAQQDDGSVSISELIAQYEQGPNDLRAAVTGMTVEQLRSRPIAGKWSTIEVVCHIADADQMFAERLKRTISTERPLLIGIDNISYLQALHYEQQNLEDQLDLVTITHRQMVSMLRCLDESIWQRKAVHSETGLMNLRQLILHPIRHLKHHLKFIAEKRAAL